MAVSFVVGSHPIDHLAAAMRLPAWAAAPAMKITKIETIYWDKPDASGFQPHWCWVRIHTDNGLTGLGVAMLIYIVAILVVLFVQRPTMAKVIALTSTPPGAEVLVDGKVVGATPTTLFLDTREEEHVIVLRRSGWTTSSHSTRGAGAEGVLSWSLLSIGLAG